MNEGPRTPGSGERYFYVTGPLREEVIPILDDGTGPSEWGCDFWEGAAKTRAEARRKAWTEWEKDWKSIVHENRSDGVHPMSGVKVTEVLPCPIHGRDSIECDCAFEDAPGFIRWVSRGEELVEA